MKIDLGALAERHGLDLAGVSSPELDPQTKSEFLKWLRSKKGPQMQYLERRVEERLNPPRYFPRVKSILCFAMNYFQGWAQGEVKLSNYSWDADYHQTFKTKLYSIEAELQKKYSDEEFRVCVDTSPVLEKYLATRAGIGWQGKNTLVINQKFGSQIFLGEIFTSLEASCFESLPKVTDHCGTCQRCLQACPTKALEAYSLDASKCISYWTLEHKGEFTAETPGFKNWVAGCDICQEVCPWNQKLIPLESSAAELSHLSAKDIGDQNWLKRIESKAVSYLAPDNWNRNLEWISKN